MSGKIEINNTNKAKLYKECLEKQTYIVNNAYKANKQIRNIKDEQYKQWLGITH